MLRGEPKKIHKKWYEIDQLEKETFPTDREYEVIVQREAIPIVFVPGIMGSRLYAPSEKNKLVWDPDDQNLMTTNFLTRGGTGQKTPQERLDTLVGKSFNSDYLKVAGTDDGKWLTTNGKYTDAVRKAIIQGRSNYWNWARRDQRMTETERFYRLRTTASGKERYGLWQPERLPWERGVDYITDENMGTYEHTVYESQLAAYNGWAGVAWSYYGKLLLRLAAEGWDPFAKCFYFPVYAFGYNWTDSNEVSGNKLKTYIDDIIVNEQHREGMSNLCKYCIVVTHSMGGLVARWASEKAGAKSKILGIIHGAQPVTGTPSAYHQFRAGEDTQDFWGPLLSEGTPGLGAWGVSRVIGSDAKHIDPIFGHCPGPLQLLPNKDYQTNVSNGLHPSSYNWLFQKNEHGQMLEELPNGDPYANVYANFKTFLGFGAQAPNVLADRSTPSDQDATKQRSSKGPRSGDEVLLRNLRLARDFHDGLSTRCHPNTFYGYGYDLRSKTYDEIVYFWKRALEPTRTVYTRGGGKVTIHDPGDPSLGQGVDFDAARNAYFRIEPKIASGDGTVSVSSATALGKPGARSHDTFTHYPHMEGKTNDSVVRVLAIEETEHSAYYQQDTAVAFTINSIKALAQNYMCRKIGKKQKAPQLPVPPF